MERIPGTIQETASDKLDGYQNVTELIQKQVQELREQQGQIKITMPEGIFLLAPGLKLSYSEYFDYGCRGGHTGTEYKTLSEEPAEVCVIESSKYSDGVTLLKITLPGDHISHGFTFDSSRMQLLRKIETKSLKQTESEEIKDKLIDLVEPDGFVFLDKIALSRLSSDCRPIYASSADPMSHPVMYRDERRYDQAMGPLKQHPVNYLSAVKTEKGVFVQIKMGFQAEETGWEPIEAIDFYYLTPSGKPEPNTEKHLAAIARRLIAQQYTPSRQDEINGVLDALNEYTDRGLRYAVAENGSRRHNHQFVFADSEASSVPNSPRRVVKPRPASMRASLFDRGTTIYTNVTELDMHENGQVWLHDKEARLATPLSRAALYLTDSMRVSFSNEVHLADYIAGYA